MPIKPAPSPFLLDNPRSTTVVQLIFQLYFKNKLLERHFIQGVRRSKKTLVPGPRQTDVRSVPRISK
jgi:hypothetical protein